MFIFPSLSAYDWESYDSQFLLQGGQPKVLQLIAHLQISTHTQPHVQLLAFSILQNNPDHVGIPPTCFLGDDLWSQL